MHRLVVRTSLFILSVVALLIAGRLPASSDSSPVHKPANYDATYRSRVSKHKIIAYAEEPELRDSILNEGGRLLEDYGSFSLLEAPTATAERVKLLTKSGASVRDDMNLILLRAHQFDTTDSDSSSSLSVTRESGDQQLYLVQMIGPIKRQWKTALEASTEVISYIPNNAFLVRASASGIARLNELKSNAGSYIQWMGDYLPEYKIAPEIDISSDEQTIVTVEIARSDKLTRRIERMVSKTQASVIGEPRTFGTVTDIRLRATSRDIVELARQHDVLWIEPWRKPELFDETQDQIVAGNYSGNTVASAAYLNWLQSKNLAATPDFVVDVADSGIDAGNLDPLYIHKDFLNPAGLARVVYARYVGAIDQDIIPEDVAGHGTINSSIIGGYNVGTAFPNVDTDGFHFGLGVHPFVKLGATRIFAPDFTDPDLTLMVALMYADGARISNNSWGAYLNSYNADCRLYDALVRDAQLGASGVQPMTIVFSSGNKGPNGHLTVPGNAKNVITVGASEGIRPGVDGCRIDDTGADTINSVASFTSSGPSDDGRVKPDILAPGTHIQGAQSQSPNYIGGGVCGPSDYPPGQGLYTWSSGTSHAAPAVSAGAALVRQYFQQSTGGAPSPAMVKALLLNSTTYVSGPGGGDNLPGNQQGWGLMNLGRALDTTPRLLVDQTQVFSDTGNSFVAQGAISDPTKPVRVTLVWSDAPGNPPALGPSVNDLDLQVEAGGKTYLGNVFNADTSVEGGTADHKNNVESVWLPAGASGNITVRVIAANIVGDGVPGASDTTDQDFALVIYNAQAGTIGGGGGPIDTPPAVNLRFPIGGERIMVGDLMRIQWDADDDKGIESQQVEFSADGANFSTIASLSGSARSFDWHVPSVPTQFGKIRVTALDGVNLPVASTNVNPFIVEQGPPDLVPPTVVLQSPNSDSIVGGGTTMNIKWRELDNVGVIQRVIDLSTDNGTTFSQILSIIAPSSGAQQSYDWQVPGELSTQRAKIRITVYDGAGNAANAISTGRFEVWPMPVINKCSYNFAAVNGKKDQLEVKGRNFRFDDSVIVVDGRDLGKIRYSSEFDTGNGTTSKVFSIDKKLAKRVPGHQDVNVQVRIGTTNQLSPAFSFRRPRTPQQ